jgi:hypothetical protein
MMPLGAVYRVMMSILYVECHICCVSQISPLLSVVILNVVALIYRLFIF